MEAKGQPTLFPVLLYEDARTAIDWLVRAFGFDKRAEFADPGTIRDCAICESLVIGDL